MGLDIYVGSLTRYYSQDWKTIVEQSAPPGVRVVTKRQNAPTSADTITDPEQIRRIILEWRASLAIAAAGVVSGAWNWDESASAPYFTDKPGWYGYNGLQMLAACKVVRLKLPKELPEDVSTDNAWREARGSKQFRQIFEPPIWLPLEFEPAFEASLPTGRKVAFGSSFTLLKQLQDLNATTLRGSVSDLERWRRNEDAPDAVEDWTLEVAAKFGLAVFANLADNAVTNRLPMLLDW